MDKCAVEKRIRVTGLKLDRFGIVQQGEMIIAEPVMNAASISQQLRPLFNVEIVIGQHRVAGRHGFEEFLFVAIVIARRFGVAV